MPKAILFDLDGTLVQTRESSWRVFAKTNAEFKLGIDTQEAWFGLLEGNMFAGLRDRAGSDERARQVSAHFLGLLSREYDPPFVPGMVDVIRDIAGSCSLAVVSSNATATIRRILTTAGLQHCFSHVFGGDVEPDKRACVRRFLADTSYSISRHCEPAYAERHRPTEVDQNQIVLVTDTVGDVRHGVECGIRVIGVSWGMHPEHRLTEAGAEFVAIWPQEILSYLYPAGVPKGCAVDAAPPAASCGCGCNTPPSEVGAASRIRRERALQNAAGQETRLVARQPPPASRPPPATADEILKTSLMRIRGIVRR